METMLLNDVINNYDINLREYNIFDEDYRETLNNYIIERFRFREIAFDNPLRFIHTLNYRLNMLMISKYNRLFGIRNKEVNLLYNIELTETYTHEMDTIGEQVTDNTTNVDNTNNGTTKALVSNFPNQSIIANDTTNVNYLENGTSSEQVIKDTTDSTTTEKTKLDNKSLESYTRYTQGSSAGLSFSNALMQAHKMTKMYDLEEQICEDLSSLFMLIYNDSDY